MTKHLSVILGVMFGQLYYSASYKTGKAYYMPQEGKIYRKLFEGELSSELATVPHCYYDNYSGWPDEVYPSGVTEVVNMTWKEYFAEMDNRTQIPILLLFAVQIFHLVQVSEKDQLIKLMVQTEKTWNDCRLRWDMKELESVHFQIMPNKFSKLDVFQPALRTLEALGPTFGKESLTSVDIFHYGVVSTSHEFLLAATCKIEVHMYPFDIQQCNLTFESILDKDIVDVKEGYHNLSSFSAATLGRYVPGDVWALIVLPPEPTRRDACTDFGENICVSSGLLFRIILRRQPFYQITNLLLPAFLIVIISSCVFLIPPGAGDKMGFSLSILLSLYMFCQLMYDKMPETGTTVPLLSQYFLVCIGLVSTSCLYSAISALVASACPHVPDFLRYLVVVLGPFLMPDLIEHRNAFTCHSKLQTTCKTRRRQERQSAVNDATQRASSQIGEAPSGEAPNEADLDYNAPRSTQFPVHQKQLFTGFRIKTPQSLTWAAVGALFDRCFFVLHLLISLMIFLIYVMKGYIPWAGYSEIIGSINGNDRKFMCEQLAMQQSDFYDLTC